MSVIIDLCATATSVPVVGLRFNHAVTTDVSRPIVCGMVTAARFVVVVLAFQQAVTTHEILRVVDVASAAAELRLLVHLVSTARSVLAE